jgi:hypothetical protein
LIDRKIQLLEDFRPRSLPVINRRAVIMAACCDRQPGEAFAMASTPGAALHGALCSAAGLHPSWSGTIGGMAKAVGMSKNLYHKMLQRGSVDTVARLAQQVGYYLVARPDGSYIAGDRQVELGTPAR